MSRKTLLRTTTFIASLSIVMGIPGTILAQTPTPSAQQCAEVKEAKNLIQQASQLYRQTRYAEAIPLVERALAIQEKVLGSEHPDVGLSLIALGELYLQMGNPAQAEPLFRRSRTTRLNALGSDYPNRVVCQD